MVCGLLATPACVQCATEGKATVDQLSAQLTESLKEEAVLLSYKYEVSLDAVMDILKQFGGIEIVLYGLLSGQGAEAKIASSAEEKLDALSEKYNLSKSLISAIVMDYKQVHPDSKTVE